MTNCLRVSALATVFLLPLLAVPGLARPFSSPKIFLLGVIVLVGLFLSGRRVARAWQALPDSLSVALALWFAAIGASSALGEIVSTEALLLPLLGIGWFLFITAIEPRARSLALALIASGTLVSSLALMQFLGADPFRWAGWFPSTAGSPRMGVYATLGNPNFVAAFLASVLPLTFVLAGSRALRGGAFWMLAGLQTLAILATGSRAAILGLAVAAAWLAWHRAGLAGRRLAAATILLALLVLTFGPSRGLATTLRGRLYIWQVAASHWLEYPLLGFGPGSFAAHYPEWETDWWRRGLGSPAAQAFAGIQDHAHNDYLEILLEGGAAGLLSFLGVLGSLFACAHGQSRCASDTLTTGASAGALALVAIALVDFPFMRPTETFAFWTLAALVVGGTANLRHAHSGPCAQLIEQTKEAA